MFDWGGKSIRIAFAFSLACMHLSSALAKGPRLEFIENKNQWRCPVLFRASLPHADIFLLPDRIQYLIRQESVNVPKSGKSLRAVFEENAGPHSNESSISAQLFEVTFQGANPSPQIESYDEGSTSYNYFVGKDKSKWASKAHGYGEVFYRNLYHRIDLKMYSQNDRVKQDWLIQPGGDPAAIKIRYDGVESMTLEDGRLIVKTHAGDLIESAPYAYQMIDGCETPVRCNFRLKRGTLSYELPDGYDRSKDLVIDPILIFSGYSGSTYDNWGNTATYDDRGNLYSGGVVTTTYYGSDFPTTPGAYRTDFIGGDWDIGILKYDSSGSSLLYCTYLGGNGTESPQSMIVNKNGDLLIMGATSSSDFPVTNGSTFKGGSVVDPIGGTRYEDGSDIYIARLSEDGSSLISATYLGGTANDGLNFETVDGRVLAKNYGDELRGDIATDNNGYVYIASNTLSSDFPVINSSGNFHGGPMDAVLVKFTPDLSTIVYSSLLGGSASDAAYSLTLDAQNGVYIAGGTTSADFTGMTGLHKTHLGDIDGWVAHISPSGNSIQQATFLGTENYDQGYFVDLDPDGNVFVLGQTSGLYPIIGSAYINPRSGQFLQKLSVDLSTSLFSTVIGSGTRRPNISPTAFQVSDCNTIYIAGWGGIINSYDGNYVGGSTDKMPVTPNAYQRTTRGSDFYLMVLSQDAKQFLYGTFLGGGSSLVHVDGGTSRFDPRGVVYHSVCAGCGGVSDFPAVNVPLARQFNRSENCNNAAFKFDLTLLDAIIQTNSTRLDNPGLSAICLTDSIVFQNLSIGGQIFEWNLGDGTTLSKPDTSHVLHHYRKSGKYRVRLKAIDPGTCRKVDSTAVEVLVYQPSEELDYTPVICSGTATALHAGGGTAYTWQSSRGDTLSRASDIIVAPTHDSTFYLTVKDINNCVTRDTANLTVIPIPDIRFTLVRKYDCLHPASIEVQNFTEHADSLYIEFGDGTSTTNLHEDHFYEKDSLYLLRVVAKNKFCYYQQTQAVPIYTIRVPNVITPVDTPGYNDFLNVGYGKHAATELGIPLRVSVYNRWGKQVYHNSEYQGDWNGTELAAGIYFYEMVVNNEVTCKSWLQIIK